jgi:hypothetical protein
MHLLSAILQQATGKTALQFAREKLFAPLGITEAIWPSDPQGVTAGWGDLHLHPSDMARIGYLWLRGGEWNGLRIVSQDWVARSSSVQIKTGDEDDYGYGWWIMTGDAVPQFSAVGRGGQRIAVFPTLNAVVVMTGAGVEPSTVFALIEKALVAPGQPLPPDLAGEARLRSVLAGLTRPPAPQPVGPMPEVAREISGLTYVFDANPLHLQTMRLDFNAGAEATLTLTIAGESPRIGRVGLDGVYRFSPGENGLEVGIRAHWADAATLLVEYDTVASIDAFDMTMQFDGDEAVIEAKDRTYQSGVRLVAHLKRTAD